MQTEFWSAALEQLPALAISLGAFIFLLIKGMAFMRDMTTTFVRHQEGRDKLMHEQLVVIGKGCHEWSLRREEVLTEALKDSREVIEANTAQHAKHEQTMLRVASALERH